LVIPARRAIRRNDPPGTVPVWPPATGSCEDRSAAALADGQVDGPGCAWRKRDHDGVAALSGYHHHPMAALHTQRLNLGARAPRCA
jgi:hypothetical protein